MQAEILTYKGFVQGEDRPVDLWQAFCPEHPDEDARPARESELSAKRDATKHNKAEHK
jgi:hypothetical protein